MSEHIIKLFGCAAIGLRTEEVVTATGYSRSWIYELALVLWSRRSSRLTEGLKSQGRCGKLENVFQALQLRTCVAEMVYSPFDVFAKLRCSRLKLPSKKQRLSRIACPQTVFATQPYPEMGNIIHWRQQAELAVSSSGLPYTIVRPGWLTNDSDDQGIHFEQGDRGEGQVTRETVAEVCVQALRNETARSKTFEIYNEPSALPIDWSAVFASLQADPVLTRKEGK